ncbi:Sec-independent protein translocase protein TatB [Sneathiella marina]|uniref:Sec-independent protein translocase protein TatB n=1 Tax=Sneathiella marina TaxID=2950108 RepID=A0ABY4VZ14_9PROT|nr:Sec-independent protein translocase protein TatB [Sneathiella marina]USG59881.1 Sec-independent protein translocase protein TatB [Sneathiella marina]
MFDIGWAEMMFVVIIAVLVIGPKDLPRAIATIGKYVRKARSMARDFQSGIDDLAKETELDEIKKDLQQSTDFNLKKQIEDAVDPTGSHENMFDDVKPQIRDPRLSENNYSNPMGESEEAVVKTATESAAETPVETDGATVDGDAAENSIGATVKRDNTSKPETKVS